MNSKRNPKDTKISKAEQCKMYEDMSECEQQFYGSVEEFLEHIDVYSNYAAPWCCYFVDK